MKIIEKLCLGWLTSSNSKANLYGQNLTYTHKILLLKEKFFTEFYFFSILCWFCLPIRRQLVNHLSYISRTPATTRQCVGFLRHKARVQNPEKTFLIK